VQVPPVASSVRVSVPANESTIYVGIPACGKSHVTAPAPYALAGWLILRSVAEASNAARICAGEAGILTTDPDRCARKLCGEMDDQQEDNQGDKGDFYCSHLAPPRVPSLGATNFAYKTKRTAIVRPTTAPDRAIFSTAVTFPVRLIVGYTFYCQHREYTGNLHRCQHTGSV
jgi:hypothetical protein